MWKERGFELREY